MRASSICHLLFKLPLVLQSLATTMSSPTLRAPVVDDGQIHFVFNGEEHLAPGTGPVEPKRLRTSCDPYLPERVAELELNGIAIPRRVGLSDLRISGSAQFGRRGLEAIVSRVVQAGADSTNIVVCDLRGESHMILNGLPVSWFANGDKLGANLSAVEVDELNRQYVSQVAHQSHVEVFEIQAKVNGTPTDLSAPNLLPVKTVQTEEMLVHREFHLGYQVLDAISLASLIAAYTSLTDTRARTRMTLPASTNHRPRATRDPRCRSACELLSVDHSVDLVALSLRWWSRKDGS